MGNNQRAVGLPQAPADPLGPLVISIGAKDTVLDREIAEPQLLKDRVEYDCSTSRGPSKLVPGTQCL